MGDYYTFDDSGVPKRDSLSLDVHLQAQETESWGERQGRERVQTPYRGIDAGQQMYALLVPALFEWQRLTPPSPGR